MREAAPGAPPALPVIGLTAPAFVEQNPQLITPQPLQLHSIGGSQLHFRADYAAAPKASDLQRHTLPWKVLVPTALEKRRRTTNIRQCH